MAAITKYIHKWIKDTMVYENVKTLDELVECGLCADLATVLWRKFGGKVRSYDDPIHVWIELDGKHYDMESPNGCKNWRRMKYFNGCPKRLLQNEPN